MNRSRFAIAALAFAVSTTAASAQSQRPLPLEPGDAFPELRIFDAEGDPFDTRSLKGQHTVLVSGCLT